MSAATGSLFISHAALTKISSTVHADFPAASVATTSQQEDITQAQVDYPDNGCGGANARGSFQVARGLASPDGNSSQGYCPAEFRSVCRAAKTITGRIVRSDNLLFLAEEGSIRTYMLADASRLRAYEGKKVRISGALDSPHVIVVRTIDEVD